LIAGARVPHERAAETSARIQLHPVQRNRQAPIARWRLAVQVGFAVLCVWIGVEFHYFVRFLESGGSARFVPRPPGAEAFLPISSMMSLRYLLQSGEVHPYHPAGLFIFVAILAASFLVGKAFCSWICPIGLLSEALGNLGQAIFRRKIVLPRWLDYPLRSLKYLLLAFFVYAVFVAMDAAAVRSFLDSPYNLMSDVKMYYFFARISQPALIVLGVLMLLSIVVRGFWCRYLCPYGGLLGLVGLASPNRIVRGTATCIDCGKCAKVCPSNIKVDRVLRVVSDECTSCLACVDACPVADTLVVRTGFVGWKWDKRWLAAAVIAVFVGIVGAAMLTGDWWNRVPTDAYLKLQPEVHSLGHPTRVDDLSRMGNEPPSAPR
jgi:polyferredoxin